VAVGEAVDEADGGICVYADVPDGMDVGVKVGCVGDAVMIGEVVSDGVGDLGGILVFGVTNAAKGVYDV
jgi:hypothetical protein